MALEVIGIEGQVTAGGAARGPATTTNIRNGTAYVAAAQPAGTDTTFQAGDIVVYLHSHEGRKAALNAPATGNTHSASDDSVKISINGGADSNMVDIGLVRGGNDNKHSSGAWAFTLPTGQTLQDIVVSHTSSNQPGQAHGRSHRLLVVRGAEDDFGSNLALGALVSNSSTAAIPDQDPVEWEQPSNASWTNTNYDSGVGVIWFASYRRDSTGVDPTQDPGGTITRPTTTDFTGTSAGTGDGGFMTNVTQGGGHAAITYFQMAFADHAAINGAWQNGNTYGFVVADGDTNGGAGLGVFFREAATATNTPLSVTDETTSLDTFDLVVSRFVEFTDEATGLDTKDSTLARVLDFTDLADALETKDQTKVKNLLLTDEATAVETKTENFGYAEFFTDESTAVETKTENFGYAEFFTDEATPLDTAQKEIGKPFSDEAKGLEAYDKTIDSLILDSAEAVETKEQIKSKTLLLTDESTAVETKAENFGYAEFFTDEATPLDTAQKGIAKVFADEAKGLEAYDKTIDSLILDSAEVVETKEQIRSKTLPLTEEAKSLDTAQKGIAKVFADEATGIEEFNKTLSSLIADSAQAVESSLKSISDFLSESADAVETKADNFGYAEFFTDVTEALDSFGKTQGLGLLEEAEADTDLDLPEKNFVEEASALETFTTTRIHFLPITESAATVDDPDLLKETPAENTVPFTEESSTEETFVVTRVFNLPITESTATVDDLDPDVRKAFTLQITDSASPVETKDETFAWTRGFTDEISTVDLLTKNTETLFTDTADVLDEPVFDFGFAVEFTDEAAGLDTAVIPGPAATRNFTESSSAADLLVTGVKIGLSISIICEGILEGKSPPQLLTKEEALAIIDVYNIALNALGVGTLSGVNDGSPQATILNDTFDSFKRQFLTDYSWNGAKKTVALSRLQDYNATDVKPVGDRWAYAYVLPNDYLRVLRINGYERYNRTQNHLQNAFEIEVVNYASSATETLNKRCLLTEEPTVNLEYIFEPTDDDLTTLLGSQTEHALGLSFAHYIARNFGKTPQEIAVLSDESRRAITAAKGVDGQEKTQRLRPDLGLVESRYWWRG